MTDLAAVFGESHRVLCYGGHMVALEFSLPEPGAWQNLYDWYSFQVIPRLGQWVAGDREAYAYLVASIRQFPPPASVVALMEQAGFGCIRTRSLHHGLVTLYSAWKL